MKNSIQNSVLLALSVGLGIAASVQAADQTYKWTEGVAGFSGTIVLDSSSSTGGSLADIVSINVTTPEGSASLTQANIGDVYINNILGPFTWNPSQITGMWVDWYLTAADSLNEAAGVGQDYQPGFNANFVFCPNNLSTSGQDFASPTSNTDTTGGWRAVSSVPDAGSTSLLLGAALTGLSVCRRFGRGK
jgi:hypothetical protein